MSSPAPSHVTPDQAPPSDRNPHLEARIAIGVAVGLALFAVAERLVQGVIVPLFGHRGVGEIWNWTIDYESNTLHVGEALVALLVLAVLAAIGLLATRSRSRS